MNREEIRLKCLSMYVDTASRYDIQKELCIGYAEKAFKFVTETPDSKVKEQPAKAQRPVKSNSTR